MVTRVIVSRETLDKAARNPQVIKALRDKADRMLPRAQRLAIAAGLPEFAKAMRVEDGVRPGAKSPKGIKRPYSRVIADMEGAQDFEHGNANVSRQSILARSMSA